MTAMPYDDVPPAEFPPEFPAETGPQPIAPANLQLLVTKLVADLELRLEFGDDAIAGEACGFAELDEHLVIEPGKLLTLGGAPGSAKTALALQIARYVATKECVVDAETGATATGKVLFIMTEMTPFEMLTRLVQGFAGLTTFEMRRRVTPQVVERAKEAGRRLWRAGVILVDATEHDIDDIVATIDTAHARHGSELRMVFVDNMSMLQHSKRVRRQPRYDLQVKDSVEALKRAAQRDNVPLWMLVHTRRPDTHKQYRPSKTDFSDASIIEKLSHVAIVITEPLRLGDKTAGFAGVDAFGGASPVDEPELWRELYVVKNRDGKPGFVVTLRFIGEQMRFEEPNGPTWRPYQVAEAESVRVAQYREARRQLDL